MSEAEERLDKLFDEAFSANHPAMLDYVALKFELKKKDAEIASLNERLSTQGNELDQLRKVVWWLTYHKGEDEWYLTDEVAKDNGLDIEALQKEMGK